MSTRNLAGRTDFGAVEALHAILHALDMAQVTSGAAVGYYRINKWDGSYLRWVCETALKTENTKAPGTW